MLSLQDLPVEVLIDHLLQSMPIKDLLNLGATSKFFASLCDDDTLWKRRLQSDFNFSGRDTARTSGWKFIYSRLYNPRVYVWGQKTEGRLGLSKFPNSTFPDVPFPVRLRIPHARIVALAAGGMSFHALDSDGNVYVWGTLNGTLFALNSDGFSESGKTASTPLKLQLPSRIRGISCGRLHTSTLGHDNTILTFTNWGRPFALSSPLFSLPNSTPVQVECGWNFTAVLTKGGGVLVWWPFEDRLSERLRARDEELDTDSQNKAVPVNGVIPCVVSQVELDPTVLPSLPLLPELSDPKSMEENLDTKGETKLIQIGGLDGSLIGLTNKGHVLKFSSLEHEISASTGTWQYLPKFSELERVREHVAFSSGSLSPPAALKITHISGHFLTFTVYSTGASSIVLMGDVSSTPDSSPKLIPALQNRSIISVVLGDYHYGALTSTGKLLTWGQYSRGALGLGDPVKLPLGTPGGFRTEQQRLRASDLGRGTPPEVQVPTEVKFGLGTGRDKPKDVFCLSATAAGWHMGALVLDREPDDDDDVLECENDEVQEEDTRHPHAHPPTVGQTPPIWPLIVGGPVVNPHSEIPPQIPLRGGRGRGFRIGYAGRGMNRGGPGRGSSV